MQCHVRTWPLTAFAPGLSRFVARLHAAPILVYGVAILLAHWYVPLSLVLFAAVPIFFILPNPFIDRRLQLSMGAPHNQSAGPGERLATNRHSRRPLTSENR